MTWTVDKKQVRALNGSIVKFDFDIADTAEVNGLLIVLLNVPPKRVMTENVFCVSGDGKLLWQIERTPATATDSANAYTAISRRGQHTIWLANWNGIAVEADVQTGKILNTQIVK